MLKFTHKKEDISTRCRICSSSSDFQKKKTLKHCSKFILEKKLVAFQTTWYLGKQSSHLDEGGYASLQNRHYFFFVFLFLTEFINYQHIELSTRVSELYKKSFLDTQNIKFISSPFIAKGLKHKNSVTNSAKILKGIIVVLSSTTQPWRNSDCQAFPPR